MKKIIIGLLLVIARSAWAGTIALETQVTATVQGENLTVGVLTTNRGTEAAYNLQFKAEAPRSNGVSTIQPSLAVGKSYSHTFQHPLKGLPPGRFLYVIRTLYADANSYPLSAVSLVSFAYQKDVVPDVLGILEKTSIRGQGKLSLKLKNLSGENRSLTLHFLLPQELSIDSPPASAILKPYEEQTLEVTIRNFSALGGSAYPVYALVEYDREGLHSSVSALGMVEVQSAKAKGGTFERIVVPVFLLLLFFFVFLNFFRKK